MNEVTTYYLEMRSRAQLISAPKKADCQVVEAKIKEFRFNKFLYQLVGEAWAWTDKLKDSDEQWQVYAEDDAITTWVAYSQGAIAGYYELDSSEHGNVNIAYFGLAPKFIGKGFGAYLLSHAIESAWAIPETTRVWVHTCTLDHEHALNNYQARGFEVYNTETQALANISD